MVCTQHAPILDESDSADTVFNSDENNDEPPRPSQNATYVADYAMRSSRSSLKRNGVERPAPRASKFESWWACPPSFPRGNHPACHRTIAVKMVLRCCQGPI